MRMPELKALTGEHILRGYYMLHKMENMRMPELKALAREHILRGYSQLRKAELIAFLQDNEHQAPRRPHPNRPPLPIPQRHTVGPMGSRGPSSARTMDVYLETKSTSTDVYLGTRT